jgi:hypothetical protein
VDDHDTRVSELPDGSLLGPGGIVYRRTPVRVKRRNGDEFIASGAAVATVVYPDGLEWFTAGDAARWAWSQIVPRLVTGKPPPARDLQWDGHVWESDNNETLLVFEGDH